MTAFQFTFLCTRHDSCRYVDSNTLEILRARKYNMFLVRYNDTAHAALRIAVADVNTYEHC